MFFFKQKTAYEMRISDWSSDVCSSDLPFIVVDAKRRVELANAMARKLLGEHIVGQDVRLALRNPAAAALLTEGAPPGSRTELLDLGGQDQRWELLADHIGNEIGRASCRERVCQYV